MVQTTSGSGLHSDIYIYERWIQCDRSQMSPKYFLLFSMYTFVSLNEMHTYVGGSQRLFSHVLLVGNFQAPDPLIPLV